MKKLKTLPIGIENFSEIQLDNYYYVDKTKLIEMLLDHPSKVNLFTRPRRFGKSLNISMLHSFFEIGTDPALFEELYISGNKPLCNTYMGQFPVIAISLKSVDENCFDNAYEAFKKVILEETNRFQFLMDSEILSEIDKTSFASLLTEQMDRSTFSYSLRKLSQLLCKHYGKEVIILIDEYDVPLAKANERGYYDEMVLLMQNVLSNALKTNNCLKLAVLTGCLRIAKESIFTGLNNFKVYSITNVDFDEYFGFTDDEVKAMLQYYGLMEPYGPSDHYDTVREWYDGYRFGNVDVYCPWDVINYCRDHLSDRTAAPRNYWINTSGNDIVNRFIACLDQKDADKKLTQTELELLVNGETVQKKISEELTYKELYDSVDNLWSTLFMTGYLTTRDKSDSVDGETYYELAIPNREVRNIITNRILSRFKESVKNDGEMLEQFCDALYNGKPELVEQLFCQYMKKTISVRDTFVRKPLKENFYHGLLLGILSYKTGWMVRSNQETGNGYSDILILIDNSNTGIIIEVKYSDTDNLDVKCREALHQIENAEYADLFEQQGVQHILKYGIACRRKECRVALQNQ